MYPRFRPYHRLLSLWLILLSHLVISWLDAQAADGRESYSWLTAGQTQVTAMAWKKMPASIRLMLAAPHNYMRLFAKHMQIENPGTDDPIIGVLVKTSARREVLETLGAQVGSFAGDICSIRIPRSRLGQLAEHPQVIYLEPSYIRKLSLDASVPENKATQVHQANYGAIPPVYAGSSGRGVLVCTIDSGIDWGNGDFISDQNNTSRIFAIWDQTLIPSGIESVPPGFAYGVEYTQQDINDEIDGSPAGHIRSKDTIGHGTHVMGIIAGDGSATSGSFPRYKYVGMAPQADLLVVKSSLSENRKK